jgi:glycosyltransferase involved in cell wall biosynthesis
VVPPVLVKPEAMRAMGYLERGEDEIYYLAKDDLYLVGTSEQSVGPMHMAEVFVLPSFSENFGIAAAEALLAGLPCVLGKGVAIAEEVAQAGAGIATSIEPKEIAQALQMLLDDENRRTQMGRRAAALAKERYSLEAMGTRLKELYSRILSQ